LLRFGGYVVVPSQGRSLLSEVSAPLCLSQTRYLFPAPSLSRSAGVFSFLKIIPLVLFFRVPSIREYTRRLWQSHESVLLKTVVPQYGSSISYASAALGAGPL
jgi:hypothetical protein